MVLRQKKKKRRNEKLTNRLFSLFLDYILTVSGRNEGFIRAVKTRRREGHDARFDSSAVTLRGTSGKFG